MNTHVCSSDPVLYYEAWYCFGGGLLDSRRTVLFSTRLLHRRCISGPGSKRLAARAQFADLSLVGLGTK